MKRANAEKRLRELGFEIDWAVTGVAEGYASGTMDAIGRGCIDGDCRGEVLMAGTMAEWYALAILIAEKYAEHGPNAVCLDPTCEFHSAVPLDGTQ